MYILFLCDEEKSKRSARIIGIANDIEIAQKAVKELLQNKVIQFVDDRFELDDVDEFYYDHMCSLLKGFHMKLIPNRILTDGDSF